MSNFRNILMAQVYGKDDLPYLCFTARATNSSVALNQVGSPNIAYIEVSADGYVWRDYTYGEVIHLDNVGDKSYWRSKVNNGKLSASSTNYYRFAMSGSIAASGNIDYILDIDGASALYATCYRYLFQDCASLVSAPELPSLVMEASCYANMFQGCTSLVSAPELPSVVLAANCYNAMFRGCTSLMSAPELPATRLVQTCYSAMFRDCTRLQRIKVHFVEWPNNTTASWLHDHKGTFVCPSALDISVRDNDHVPPSWTIEPY